MREGLDDLAVEIGRYLMYYGQKALRDRLTPGSATSTSKIA
jgi:hypothetical protein